MHIDGETRLIGFFGSTYRTSKMYAMYNAAIRALGLNYVYVPFAVRDLAHAVAGMRHLGIAAVGVTIPYKVAIVPLLDELDADAARIGSVNVVVHESGWLRGGNTDGQGALRALREQTRVTGKRVVVLGAGGAARAVVVALVDAGSHVTVLNRSLRKAQALAGEFGVRAGGLDEVERAVAGADVLVQTTPVGMVNTPHEIQSLVPPDLLHPGLTVMELVSKPRRTPLVRAAEAAGCRVVLGDRMLLWQGVLKFRAYTGVEPPIEVMERALVAAGDGS